VNKFRVDYNDNIYYLVDGKRIHSKIAAIHAAQGNMDKISFHWMEDVWDIANWNNEPSTEWSELLRMRCQQLRDKYKYLALWYSSGYDSHTILRSFVDNGILLDELLIYDRGDFFNDPETQFALQHANHVKNTYYPNLKINHIRINYKSLSKFYNDLLKNNEKLCDKKNIEIDDYYLKNRELLAIVDLLIAYDGDKFFGSYVSSYSQFIANHFIIQEKPSTLFIP